MKVLSLFDGISCGMVAMERAGISVEKYVAYEIDENAIKISQTHYPNIVRKGDVFKADFAADTDFDILIGGSPCTNWSIAQRKNRETTSSGIGWELFSQYVRALHEVNPKYFLYENNASMSTAIRDEITKALGVEPVMIDSADFSAQHRKRLYWTNIPVLPYTPSDILFEDIMVHDENCKTYSYAKYAATERVSRDGMTFSWDSSGRGLYSQQSRARLPHQKWNTLAASGNDKNNVYLGNYTYRKIHPLEVERLQTLPDNYTDCLSSINLRIHACGNGWTVDVISHILKGLICI